MNQIQFDKIVEERIGTIRKVLSAKRKEYAAGGRDRLANFIRAAERQRISREKALIGMLEKHAVSILDIIDDLEQGIKPSLAVLDEKCTDICNYYILLEAMLKEDCGYIK